MNPRPLDIRGCAALVTGANRGLGRAFALALLERGARTVYAGVRDPSAVSRSGLVPIKLDVTNPDDVADAARLCADITLLINNAGILRAGPLLAAGALDAARDEMNTNYFGTLAMCRAFAPVLGRNGGGALVNMLSVLSWTTLPLVGSYAASKAAAWSLTNGIRQELHAQGTLVVGVHVGFIDTDMAAGVRQAKVSPAEVARQVLDAVEAGDEEVLADDVTRSVKAQLSGAAHAFR